MSESDGLRLRVSLGHLFWVPIYFSFILFYNAIGNHTCKENLVMTPPPFSTNKNFNFNIPEMFFNYQYCFFINFSNLNININSSKTKQPMFFPNKTKVVSTNNVFLGEDQLIEDSSVNNYIIVVRLLWFKNCLAPFLL